MKVEAQCRVWRAHSHETPSEGPQRFLRTLIVREAMFGARYLLINTISSATIIHIDLSAGLEIAQHAMSRERTTANRYLDSDIR